MIDVMIDLAGLLAAAALLITLIALEVRRAAGPDTGQPTRPGLLGLTVSHWVVAVMWTMYLLLFLPRVLGLLV
ncbi:hypothetical protein [Pseudarthrobacter sp. SSS035]|uniref:hypothetical protein n=1 Tax=Pseudarthrobacter sp. SSS035 TaxID=2931399 RepID=UPI00200D7C90|nr:hypothetical protein [Pseudarthrobacter sp. SSS035]